MLRLLNKDGSKKRDHQITQKERERMKKIDEGGRNLVVERGRGPPGSGRREK